MCEHRVINMGRLSPSGVDAAAQSAKPNCILGARVRERRRTQKRQYFYSYRKHFFEKMTRDLRVKPTDQGKGNEKGHSQCKWRRGLCMDKSQQTLVRMVLVREDKLLIAKGKHELGRSAEEVQMFRSEG